jgi:hypothetical protein
MTPPQLQIALLLLFNAGLLPIITVGEPGTHGAAIAGMHGIGVRIPSAAAVAAATVGLLKVVHMPNGMMFTIGLLSMIVATGISVDITRFSGNTMYDAGATPKLHWHIAPGTTTFGTERDSITQCAKCHATCRNSLAECELLPQPTG